MADDNAELHCFLTKPGKLVTMYMLLKYVCNYVVMLVKLSTFFVIISNVSVALHALGDSLNMSPNAENQLVFATVIAGVIAMLVRIPWYNI